MKLVVGSQNPVKVNAARIAMDKVLGNIGEQDVLGVDAPSLVADQPMTEAETRLGAVNRVKACMQTQQADWYIAIEGGVDCFEDGPATFAYVAICNGKQWSVGRSANLPLPNSVYQALVNGEELGPVMDRTFNTVNVKQKGGAIGLLTNNLATRQSVYELAVILAMSPFNHASLFSA
ncbi:inosine/xanthosine triphosphatase [Aestuariibacter sp. GS-14]|uniref:inosine/xanthosine triphosphatase n=1 Tax=Alteromonadaceae TaxID=72275 RepID=UPI0015E8706A|nr:inosine/xanthosine triphosphatase [Aestuariibacter sp. GS-14]